MARHARPNRRAEFGAAWERIFAPPIAHRGLWAEGGPPENSLSAFQAACEAGYSVELDVRRSADGEAIVFHDAGLRRMTGLDGRVCDFNAEALAKMALVGADDTIPRLADALTLVGHRAMVFIELKVPFGEVGPLERRLSELLIDHNGPTCVIGFNPYSHAWFADHHPQILRGLSSYGWRDSEARHLAPELRRGFARLEHVDIARPHFLCLDRELLPSTRVAALRRGGLPIVAWTFPSRESWNEIAPHCDNLIFEGFTA